MCLINKIWKYLSANTFRIVGVGEFIYKVFPRQPGRDGGLSGAPVGLSPPAGEPLIHYFTREKIYPSSASLSHQLQGRRVRQERGREQEQGHPWKMGNFCPGRTGGEGEKVMVGWRLPRIKASW